MNIQDWFPLGLFESIISSVLSILYGPTLTSLFSGWMNHKQESKLLGEISAISDMQMTPTLFAESEEELKNLLMKVKEEIEKVGLKLNILEN